MLSLLLSILILAPQGPKSADPAEVVLRATRGVMADSVNALTSEWKGALERNPADPAALLGLATLARLTYDYVAAEQWYQKLVPQVGPDRFSPWVGLGRAHGLLVRGQRKQAALMSEFAVVEARQIGDASVQLQAQLLLSLIHAQQDPAAARAALSEAEKQLRVRDPRLRALYDCTRANVLALNARQEARQAAARGAQSAQEQGDRRLEAQCRYAAAIAFFGDGDVPNAGGHIVKATELQRATRDQVGLASTLALGGRVLASVGNLALAQQYLDEAVTAAKASGNAPALASATLTRSRLALETGDLLHASESAQQAHDIYEGIADQIGRVDALRLMGRIAWELGADAEADRLILQSADLERRMGIAERLLDMHQLLAYRALLRGRTSEAIAQVDSARAAGTNAGMLGWLPFLSFARLRIANLQNDFIAADSALEVLTSNPAQPTRVYEIRMLAAERFAREGRLDEAEDSLRSAAGRLDQWRASLSDDRLRLLAYQIGRAPGDPDLGFATIISKLALAGRVPSAFRFAEQRRARELLDRFRFHRFFGGPNGDTSQRARIPESATTLAEVQRAMPDSTVLIEYVVGRGGEPTTVFLVTRSDAIALQLLSIDAMAPMIERFTTLVEHQEETKATGRALGKLLIDPVLAKLPAHVRRLVIVPADVLHRVPFDALVMENRRYLFERFSVAIAPSAAVAAILWQRPRETRSARLLAFGDPAFASIHADSGTAVRAAFAKSGGLPALPGARAEVEAAARYFDDVDVRIGSAATEQYLKHATRRPHTVLHLATHAQADDRSALLTTLALAPGEGEDGLVHGEELGKLDLPVDLVLLSACRTAGGLIVGGEGVQGLTAPLLAAGARSVIATQWRVSDRATTRFVKDLYRALARGATVSDALRKAKTRALRRGAPPAEWAAFVLIGDPLTTVPLQAPRSRLVWVAIALAVTLLVALAWWAKRHGGGRGV
jgi:CHAT domain-containing protein/tetratricopeptide (TPR) repeat protein